jgi:hypothetical protein
VRQVLAENMTPLAFGMIKEIIGRDEGDYMTRIHLTPWRWWPWKKRLYLHLFDRPDLDPWPHDHPFPFRSIVLLGGYTELIFPYRIASDTKRVIDGTNLVGLKTVRRRMLTSHAVPASHCHKIVQLHGRRTVTLVIRGEKEQDWGFFVWNFRDGIQKVPWWEYIGLPAPEKSAY